MLNKRSPYFLIALGLLSDRVILLAVYMVDVVLLETNQ